MHYIYQKSNIVINIIVSIIPSSPFLGLLQELGQLIGYLVRNIFMEKVYRKSALKTSAIPLFNFGK